MDSSNPASLNPLFGEHYNLNLSQAVQSLLSKLGSETTAEFSQSIERFHELVQARVDPPLESIWVYASLSFRSRNHPKAELLDRISSAKELFHFVSACSSTCGSSKSVALLAPVVYEVHEVLTQLLGKANSDSKKEKKAMREVRSLVEAILGYVNVCCSSGFSEEGDSGSVSCFSDLVRIWAGSDAALGSFLPLVNDEICEKLGEGECEVSYLAGVVILEVFLLKLCLSVKSGIPKEDLEKGLRIWAVGSLTGFGNFYFLETLVRMLLVKTLPLALLGSSEDEALIRKVLFDAVILVDYSFMSPERTAYLPADRVRKLAIAILLVTHEGVLYFRECGDWKKSISYINAFCNSCLASQIIKWIKNHIHLEENTSKIHGSSPTALIKWLLNLESRNVKVFDDSVLKSCAELVRDTSVTELQQQASEFESMKSDDDLYYFDNKREELEADDKDADEKSNEAATAAFVAAARSMKSSDDKRKKRKGVKKAEKEGKRKFLKYEPMLTSEAPTTRSFIVSDDGESSGSEVENPLSDDDSDQSEQ